MTLPALITGARLPRWCLPADWPRNGNAPALADLRLDSGRIASIDPSRGPLDTAWNLHGAPVLPGLVEAHCHIDKALTRHRLGTPEPGLLGAIRAMAADRDRWTAADVRERASRCLQWAFDAGVATLRTHCDWWDARQAPLAWNVLRELAEEWAGRLVVERVALIPLPLFADRDDARALARTVAAGGSGACLGGFVHSTNWDAAALRRLFEAAEESGLDVDLHVDEELNSEARGLATTAALVREIGFGGRVVCGHCCALAEQPEAQALATLDAVAAAPITLVALPLTNLLLQDAQTGRTPRRRGITLVNEARARGIPVLIGSDNVQDAFCPVGSFDPVEALAVGLLAAQLDDVFDTWSESVCRGGWLTRRSGALPLQPGGVADLVVFGAAEVHGWPARTQPRTVLRSGRKLAQ